MIRSKTGSLLLGVMVLGVMAVSAGAAQAHLFEWLILNGPKTTATELSAELKAERDSLYVSLLTHLLGLSVEVSCHEVHLSGANLELGGTLSGKVQFLACEAYDLSGGGLTPLGCHVHSTGAKSGTVETSQLKGALLLHENAPGQTLIAAHLEPKEGTTVVTILTEECLLPESNPVRGVLFIRDCQLRAEVHSVKHLIDAVATLTALWVGAHTAEHLETSIVGSGWVKLSGADAGLEWGAKHNIP
jgi:hypothetical protein